MAENKDNVPEEPVSQEDVVEKEHEIEVPEKWKVMPLAELVDKGWKYRLMTKPSGLRYMCIRKANSERSLGRYTPELEKLLFDM
ncbi:hypothetical protein MUP77_21200, partial [Candidatus Bathyarchaeota archaeon]|nr:hypothetical protein [Candidatus Bathyarchaeota archaeon]